MTLSKAVRSIHQAVNLFVLIETDKGEEFCIKTSIYFVGCSNLNVYPILKLYVLKFANLTQNHF